MTCTPIAKLRKGRGVVRASITRLRTRLTELEDAADQPHTPDHARQLLGKLRSLDEEFRGLHYELIDLIDEDDQDSLETEQVTLDKHDDEVATLTVRLETLSTSASHAGAVVVPDPRKPLSRRHSRIRAGLKRIRDIVTPVDAHIEPSVLMQCQEETTEFKRNLAALYDELITKAKLSVAHSALEVELSDIYTPVEVQQQTQNQKKKKRRMNECSIYRSR